MEIGTDVNFGSLTRAMFKKLVSMRGVSMHFNQDVRDISRNDHDVWSIKLKDLGTGTRRYVRAKFVFIGAGGGSLPLFDENGHPGSKTLWRFSGKRAMVKMYE
jgi:malate dehydrogenase (quinone)